jgi:hypothetical protein
VADSTISFVPNIKSNIWYLQLISFNHLSAIPTIEDGPS